MHTKTHHVRHTRGFTLIELLVVISIIGLLSSVVLASLNSARAKGKDASIKANARELVSLMALEYSDNQSYCNLQKVIRNDNSTGPGWITLDAPTCTNAFGGTYASQAQQICTAIYNNAGDNQGLPGTTRIYVGTNPYTCASTFSFIFALNDGNWYCIGSSGRGGEYASYSGNPGCYNNP